MLDQFSLCVMNTVGPTHFTSDSSSLIDHIIVRSDKCANVSVCNQISGVSAHDLVYISCVVDFPQDSDQFYEYRCYKHLNSDILSASVDRLDWSTFYECYDVDDCNNILTSNMSELLNVLAPLKRRKVKKECIPWYDPMVKKNK